jgi:hypothetical protein
VSEVGAAMLALSLLAAMLMAHRRRGAAARGPRG